MRSPFKKVEKRRIIRKTTSRRVVNQFIQQRIFRQITSHHEIRESSFCMVQLGTYSAKTT